MIKCKKIGLEYVSGKPVLQNLSLHLEPESFTLLLGGSGAGKSSLLNIFSLAMKPTTGSLQLFGQEITTLHHSELPLMRRRIGTVFQDYQLLNHLTIAENVALPLKVTGEPRKVIRNKVMELLDWVGLKEHYNVKPPHLSGGQKQRVAIARAVINKPDILIADEPTGNLDPQLSMKFMHLFTTLNKNGTTILIATHDEHMVSYFDYPVLYLKNGAIARHHRLAA